MVKKSKPSYKIGWEGVAIPLDVHGIHISDKRGDIYIVRLHPVRGISVQKVAETIHIEVQQKNQLQLY